MLERASSGVYRNRFSPVTARPIAASALRRRENFEFCRTGDAERWKNAAAREHVHLITVNNRYSAREALRNADLLIKERVDLVLEYQTYERVAPVIASKFLEANTPVIAIEIPHPGAAYFGANNYKAGLIGGKALGRWAREHWDGKVEQIVLLELPIAGSLLELRITGLLDGLRAELPSSANANQRPTLNWAGRLPGAGAGDDPAVACGAAPARRTLIGTRERHLRAGRSAGVRGSGRERQVRRCGAECDSRDA